jgi:hypothetical protein
MRKKKTPFTAYQEEQKKTAHQTLQRSLETGQNKRARPTADVNSLNKDSNDNGTRIMIYGTSSDMVISDAIFPRRNIHKITWICIKTPPTIILLDA